MKISDEIMRKVTKKEEEKLNLNRCLAVRVCPNCGGNLTRKSYNDGGKEYVCNECNRIYER